LSSLEAERTAALAVQVARASALANGHRARLGEPVQSRGTYTTPLSVDPFTVSIEDKLALLLQAEAAMARVPGARVRQANLGFQRERKHFASTDGADLTQTLYEAGGGLTVIAVDENEVQRRSYPTPFRQMGTAGWEYVLGLDLPGQAERIAEEAVALLSAPECPEGLVTTVIIGSEQLALQIHESCGHPAELDRLYGAEAAYAGSSFLRPDMLGRYRYGSPLVNLTADALRPTGLGTYGWDDEGVPATATPLVRDGIFAGYLMSRETATALGLPSNGCMRAEGWNRLPLVRMANVSLEPGTWDLDGLIADTDDGLYLETNRSWSIDDKRYNFQFGTEVGYANCGKGQPSQIAHTGHGAAPARFRRVRVGVL
jgi:TldD protein